MRLRRVLSGLLGLAVLAVGLTMAGEGPLRDAVQRGVELAGNDYLLLAALGGVGLLLAGAMLVSGRSGNLEQTEMPDPERPVDVPTPGDEFDAQIRRTRFKLPVVGRSVRRDVERRLRTAAVDATLYTAGCSRVEAERRVENGSWTDDTAAAAFLSADTAARSPVRHVTPLFDGETLSQRRARRTVAEIATRTRPGGAE
jgi:hypothetical protein